MKKGFTLVELMIVVVVIVTLMGVTFRLAGVGSDSTARNTTVNRLQRLENCLSGYYAAYGSYPPVKLHNSRDFRREAESHGLQKNNDWAGSLKDNWKSVDAACKAQPIGMTYPFNKQSARDTVRALSQMLMEANPGEPLYNFEALLDNSFIDTLRDKTDWQDCQVFKFGVLSYLVPRYLVIMGGDVGSSNNDQIFTRQSSWKVNNQLPPRFEDGVPYANWADVNSAVKDEPWKIAALTSQATTARWLPNLEKQLSTMQDITVYGINLRDEDSEGTNPLDVYSVGGADSSSQQFFPDRMTIKDGWGNEFYYCSTPPHQSYTLWSAGKNEKTFPPWVTDEELGQMSGEDRKTVQTWIADDIVQMSN